MYDFLYIEGRNNRYDVHSRHIHIILMLCGCGAIMCNMVFLKSYRRDDDNNNTILRWKTLEM